MEIRYCYKTSDIANKINGGEGCHYLDNAGKYEIIPDLKHWVSAPENSAKLYKLDAGSLRFIIQHLTR